MHTVQYSFIPVGLNMTQLLQRLPLAISVSTALVFVLSIIYDLAFFARFGLTYFLMMTISDHIASSLEFIPIFIVIMFALWVYIFSAEAVWKWSGLSTKALKARFGGQRVTMFEQSLRMLLRVISNPIWARSIILLYPSALVLFAIWLIIFSVSVEPRIELAVAITCAVLGGGLIYLWLGIFVAGKSLSLRWCVFGIVALNVLLWPAALGVFAAYMRIEISSMFHIRTHPGCKFETEELAVLILRSIERGLIVVEADRPAQKRIISWPCISSVATGETPQKTM